MTRYVDPDLAEKIRGEDSAAMTLHLNRDKILDLVGEFTWGYSTEFFVETSEGNFVWDKTTNVLRSFQGDYTDWLFAQGIPYGRDKGKKTIREFCGDDVLISNEAL